jgi:hypothetical protein
MEPGVTGSLATTLSIWAHILSTTAALCVRPCRPSADSFIPRTAAPNVPMSARVWMIGM